jgi:hypothetical protein
LNILSQQNIRHQCVHSFKMVYMATSDGNLFV